MNRLSLVGILVLSASPALANVPVGDSALLDRKSETATTITNLKPIVKSTSDKTKGVNCAVTKSGRKADVRDPSTPKDAATGRGIVEKVAPSVQPNPTRGSTAGLAAERNAVAETTDVAASSVARQSSLDAVKQQYESLKPRVGSSETIKASMDENSSIRAQNGIAWNTTVDAANSWTQALNVVNMLMVANMSQASGAIRTPQPPTPPTTPAPVCPVGTTGSGTSTSPCVSNRCSTTAYGRTPDPACVIRRYADSTGNVTVYLAHMQDHFGVTGIPDVLTLPIEPPTTLAGNGVNAGDIQSALNRYRNGQ